MKSLSVLILLLASFSASAQYSNKNVIDNIIAKVDDKIILESELHAAFKEGKNARRYSSDATKCDVLAQMVTQKIMAIKAEQDTTITASEDRVESTLDQRMSYYIQQIGSKEKLEEYYNKSIEEFKEEMRADMREQLLVQQLRQKILKDLNVSPAEVKEYFNNIPPDSLPYYSSEVHAGQIVKKPSVNKNQKEKAINFLSDLKTRIKNGEDFAKLAREHSHDPGSAQRGGNLGFQAKGDLVPSYEKAALNLDSGEISDPIESQFGIHLIQMLERRGNQYKSRHILRKPTSSTPDMQEATDSLKTIRKWILNDSLDFPTAAKKYSEDKETATNGGYFRSQSGSYNVPTDQLDPDIFFIIDTMEIGSITKPIPFEMKDGTKAARIIYYKSRNPPHMANLKDDYQKIQQVALEEKKVEKFNKWLEQARNDIYLYLDDKYEDCEILSGKSVVNQQKQQQKQQQQPQPQQRQQKQQRKPSPTEF